MTAFCLTFSFFVFAFSSTLVAGSAEECHKFSVGKCDPEAEVILAKQHIPCPGGDLRPCMAACQSICAVTARCNYFTYGESDQDCYLMAQADHNGYLSTCALIAGPAEPSLADCDSETPTDSCNLFVAEDCEYPGEVVYTSTDVVSAADCQILLSTIGALFGGDLFLHDTLQQNLCEFRSSPDRNCSRINGPAAPPFMDCFGDMPTFIPTTLTPTTFTPTTFTPSTLNLTTLWPTTFNPTSPHYDTVNLTFSTFNAIDNNVLPAVSIIYDLESTVSRESVITNTNGQVTITISDVSFPISIKYNATKEGFIPSGGSFLVKNEEPEVSLTLSLTPVLEPDQDYRLVMNWGHSPRDLDLHVVQFSNTDPNYSCETFYGNSDGCDGLYLDVDNTHGGDNGAETITWTEPGDNWYLLFVFDYSRSNTTLVKSEAKISLYAESLTSTEYVPTTDTNPRSTYWVLGCFDGAIGVESFKRINALEEDDPKLNYPDCSMSNAYTR